MQEEHSADAEGSDRVLNDAASIRADVLGSLRNVNENTDDEDDGPKEELTTGEIRYWQYQVRTYNVSRICIFEPKIGPLLFFF